MDTRSASTGRGSDDRTDTTRHDRRPPAERRRPAFPRAGRAGGSRLLHAYIATAPRTNAEPSLVFVDETAGIVERTTLASIGAVSAARDRPSAARGHPGRAPASAPPRLAFYGIVYALWNARRLGYRRIALHVDDPAVVTQMNKHRQVDPEAVGLYLQARALMHLYRSAQIDVGELVLSVLEPADHLVIAGTATSA